MSLQSEELQNQEMYAQLLRGLSNMPKMTLNPFPRYRAMRESNPIYYNEENKWWEVFTYSSVQRVITDHASFSSERFVPSPASNEEDLPIRNLSSTDPPRHNRLRSLISQAFSPEAAAQLTPHVTAIVNKQLDTVAATGQMDVVKDLSSLLPVNVIAEMLGIPSEDYPQFKRRTDAILTPLQADAQPVKEMTRYFKEIIAQRHNNRKDDLISALLSAQINGEHLTEPEVISFCMMLLTAGTKTITNLIGNAVLCFDNHPEVMDQLRNDPSSLLPGAIEEVLRYLSPVQLLIRAATVDTVIDEKEIKAGQIVIAWLGSANHDEMQFSHPDVFDIRRTLNRHLAFGDSIHLCIGAPLARLEAKIALGVMLERFTDIKRVDETPIEPIDSFFAYGLKSLPIAWSNRRV